MLCTLTSDGEFTVEEAGIDEEFSPELLAVADRRFLTIEDGVVVIRALNGTWWYQIVGFSSSVAVQTTLIRQVPK